MPAIIVGLLIIITLAVGGLGVIGTILIFIFGIIVVVAMGPIWFVMEYWLWILAVLATGLGGVGLWLFFGQVSFDDFLKRRKPKEKKSIKMNLREQNQI